ncbi:hypothetical protein CC1G_04515 [Coprinopsis cinerea okayama7|uniref:SET domain-containing protein n=1 Tax=Coprinopsis cinerea (strain Okayama-7 / 130 / ATCC MYA-4618 / FGSC 9003) TaxID=240176 RepID=A8N5D7_COPC7|nr:hypothetical protein CC1G_04515 [Coprinopsis cinerea okayama7\|eukprot:XP_001830082.1 hypothetical protein CC1G_04515 [Coprinopsis cinerea okayama7\
MPSTSYESPYVHHVITLPPALPSYPPATISTLMHPSMIPLLPSPLPTAAPPVDNPPFKVIKTPDRGFGMFAARRIEEGSLIIVEHPVFVVPAMPLPQNAGIELYEGVAQRMPRPEYEEMTTLANCRSNEECPTIVEGVARTNALNLQFRFPEFADSTFEGGRHYGGAFLKINRCNHSCGPNAAYRWDVSKLAATLYALRDISEGEEITITYADPLQSRAARLKKLEPDYRFTCDCHWCTFKDPLDQEKSDATREYLKSYVSTHPSYRKWSTDLCLPDTFVIDSHMAVLPMIIQEGVEAMLPLFFEEILRCYAELGHEDQVKLWAKKTIRITRYSNPALAGELERIVEDPVGHFAKWGSRTKLRQVQGRRGRKQIEVVDDDFFMGNLFGSSMVEVEG